jgi:CheY-like chemotaxis protein
LSAVKGMKIGRIIFVDDDKVNNSLSRIIVRQALGSFDTQTFEKPVEAFEFLSSIPVEGVSPQNAILLLLDINMPVMNGWTFLDKVSGLPDSLKNSMQIYILSSSIDPRDKEKAEAHPLVSGYISKPLASNVLHGLIYPSEVQPSQVND